MTKKWLFSFVSCLALTGNEILRNRSVHYGPNSRTSYFIARDRGGHFGSRHEKWSLGYRERMPRG